jgi:aminodeoxyfutalosine deaminase
MLLGRSLSGIGFAHAKMVSHGYQSVAKRWPSAPKRPCCRLPARMFFVSYPKIELHIHLEGSVLPAALLQIASRNGLSLPADSVEEMARLYEFRDFPHFLEVWALTTACLRTERDFRQVVTGYAAQAASHGAVYLEAIFTPAEPVARGVPWEEVFAGYCDGAQEAWETHGVRVALTPDIPRGYPIEAAELTVTHALAHADRGIVGVGLGGAENACPPEPFGPIYARAKDGGLGSVPHAGESEGPASIRAALEIMGADRIRHGIRSVEDPGLLRELAARGIVLDVCPTSNVRTGVVRSLAEHPLPDLLAAGIKCTVNTDDPAMFGSDLASEHQTALSLGASARACYEAGLAGALCDETIRTELRQIGENFNWPTA